MTNVTISKGSYTVTIHTVEATEDYANQINVRPLPQTKQKQSTGPKGTKVSDLLKITHTLLIRGWINKTATKTAKQVLDELKSIFKGADVSGSPATIVYDGDSLSMFPEKLTIIKKPLRRPESPSKAIAQYQVQIQLTEGTSF